jgi:hypothetical protein
MSDHRAQFFKVAHLAPAPPAITALAIQPESVPWADDLRPSRVAGAAVRPLRVSDRIMHFVSRYVIGAGLEERAHRRRLGTPIRVGWLAVEGAQERVFCVPGSPRDPGCGIRAAR